MILKLLKWGGLLILVVTTSVLLFYAFIKTDIDQRIDKTYHFPQDTFSITTDDISLARGKHLSVIRGCQDCHGSGLEGKVMNEDKLIGTLSASNLTRGAGGLPPEYTSVDWVNALRHGINRNGKPLLFMPSHESALLSDTDLSALIAYCESVPPVDNQVPTNKLGPFAYVMSYFDKLPLLSVEKIEHDQPALVMADSSESVAHGKYLAVSCIGCHRTDFHGGDPLAPGLPPVPDITSSGNVGGWTREEFIATLRTGKSPSGHQIKNEDMPWQMTAQYTDKELVSLFLFLSSI